MNTSRETDNQLPLLDSPKSAKQQQLAIKSTPDISSGLVN